MARTATAGHGADATPPGPLTRHERIELGGVLVLVTGVLALLAGKAFTIDDPMYLWLGKHIAAHPLDPFGFAVNWNASQLPMNEINQNPPATGYWIALAGSLLGWSEVALHVAFLVPAAAATAATFGLARRLCAAPLEATLVALLTPAFLVSASNIMCESLVLACWTGSVLFWVTGFDRDQHALLFAGAALAALAFVSKFSAVALPPLLLAYGLLRTRRVGAWCLHLLVPLAAIVAYELATAHLYGTGHFTFTLRFAQAFGVADEGMRGGRVVVGLAFAGGCLAPALLFAPLLWSRRALAVGAAVAAVLLVAWPVVGPALDVAFPGDHAAARWTLPAQLIAWALAGASLVPLAGADLWRRRDPDAALLVLWLLGMLVFATLLNWVSNGRSILPMAPAFGILVVRRLRDRGIDRGLRRGLALVASAGLALAVAHADARWANDVRDSARRLVAAHVAPGHDTYFLGNWGLQHYLSEAGAIAVDQARFPQAGDRLILSDNNTDRRRPPRGSAERIDVVRGHEPRGLRTLSRGIAGFYASAIGPLPFAWAPGEGDRYVVWELSHPVRFTPSW